MERRYAEAVTIASNSVVRFPTAYWPRALLAQCLIDQGNSEAALPILNEQLAIRIRPLLLSLKGYALGRMGRRDEARLVLDQLVGLRRAQVNVQPYFVARVWISLGDRQAALEALEQAAEERSIYLLCPDWSGLRTDPAWDELQGHSRFQALLERVGPDQ